MKKGLIQCLDFIKNHQSIQEAKITSFLTPTHSTQKRIKK